MDPRIISAADHFEFDEQKHLPFKKFFEAYKDQFPMLAIIVEGWYGETRYDCFDNYQVIRIHCYTTQPRVVAVDSQESAAYTKYHYLTIPVHYEDLQYKVIKGHSTVGERQTMETILKENKLPVLVRMSCEHRHGIRVDSTPMSISSFGNLLITDTFDDHYLIMNCVDGSELKMNSITCMAMLSNELTATPITGFKYRSAKEFQEFLQRLDQQVATSGVKYDKSAGNPVILKFEKELDLQPVIASWTPEGPAPPVPKRIQAPTHNIEEDEGGNDDYEELDPEWQFPPEIPARSQTSKTSVDNKTPHQAVVLPKKAEKLKKGLFSIMHIGKSKHETKSPPHPADKPDKKLAHGDDHSREADETTNDPQKPHYINTDIGRAVVKPIQKDKTATPTPSRKTAPKTAPGDRPAIAEPSIDSEEQGVYCDVYEMPGDEICSESKPKPNSTTSGSDKEKIEKNDENVTVEFTIANLAIKDIANVLGQLKLSKYVEVFQENDIDGEILSCLAVDDLVNELGMKKLEAIKLDKYVHTGHIPK